MVKNLFAKAGDTGSILVLGRSLGEGQGYTLHYSCLENSTDRGTAVHVVAKRSDTSEQLTQYTNTHTHAPYIQHPLSCSSSLS